MALLEDLAASVVTEIELRAPRPRVPGVQIAAAAGQPAGCATRRPACSTYPRSRWASIGADGRWLRVNPARWPSCVGTTSGSAHRLPGRRAHASRSTEGPTPRRSRLLLAGECASYASEKRCSGPAARRVWVVSTVTVVPVRTATLDRFHVALQDISDRKRAEQELRGREERYRLAAEATQDAVWDWDLLTDRLVWSEPEDGGFGYPRTPAGLSAAWWYERLHADDRERVVSGIHAAIARGATAWTDAYRFRRADGSYAHVQDRGAIVRDEAGDAVRMIGALDRRHRADAGGSARARAEPAARADRGRTRPRRGARAGGPVRRVARAASCWRRSWCSIPSARMLRLAAGPEPAGGAAGGARRSADRDRTRA